VKFDPLLPGRAHPLEFRHVGARRKGFVAVSAQHNAAKGRIGASFLEGRLQFTPHLNRQRVALTRLADRDGRNLAFE